MKLRHGLAALGVAAVLLVPAAYAQQGPDGGPPPPGGFGGPGGPGGFGGGGRGGGRGGFGGRLPFATGTVTAVDAGAGTVTVTSPFGGQSQTIQTQGTTTIATQTAALVSDLKIGDKVQVQGVPTSITASRLTIGDSPLTPPGGGPGGFGGPGRAGGGPGGPGGPGGANAAPAQAFATGTVSSTKPLTLKISDTVSMTLKMDPTAKVTRFTTTTLSAVKVGDRVVATGQSNDDGSFAATTLGVNVDMGGGGGFGGRGGGGFGGGGFGGGGFGGGGRRGGGRRGGGGQGGPGQGGPGQGGPGGGFGGGGFGGPGAGGPPPPDEMPQ